MTVMGSGAELLLRDLMHDCQKDADNSVKRPWIRGYKELVPRRLA